MCNLPEGFELIIPSSRPGSRPCFLNVQSSESIYLSSAAQDCFSTDYLEIYVNGDGSEILIIGRKNKTEHSVKKPDRSRKLNIASLAHNLTSKKVALPIVYELSRDGENRLRGRPMTQGAGERCKRKKNAAKPRTRGLSGLLPKEGDL